MVKCSLFFHSLCFLPLNVGTSSDPFGKTVKGIVFSSGVTTIPEVPLLFLVMLVAVNMLSPLIHCKLQNGDLLILSFCFHVLAVIRQEE